MISGMMNLPERSITVASFGGCSCAEVVPRIFSPSMTRAALARGGPPLPSMMVTLRRTVTCAEARLGRKNIEQRAAVNSRMKTSLVIAGKLNLLIRIDKIVHRLPGGSASSQFLSTEEGDPASRLRCTELRDDAGSGHSIWHWRPQLVTMSADASRNDCRS